MTIGILDLRVTYWDVRGHFVDMRRILDGGVNPRAQISAALCAFCGAGDGTRTRDSLLGRQVLYQLSYPRVGLK
jgi:hypothetical protein